MRHALVERLMHYYHFMAENHGVGGDARYTSNQIAKLVRMDDSLIRKDLAEVGVRGQPGYGFRSA